MKPRDLANYSALALIWGFSFLLLVKTVPAFGWAGTTAFRAIIAGLTLFGLARGFGRQLNVFAHWQGLLVVAATTVVGQYVGIAIGAPRIGTAMSAILISTVPLFSMLISQAWGIERFSVGRIAGLLLGMAGVAMLVGFPQAPITEDFLFGVACCLLSCVSAAYGSVYASHRLKAADPWAITAGAFLSGGLLALPLLWFVPIVHVPLALDYVWLGLLGALISGIGYMLYFGLVSSIGATRAVSVEFVVTVIAVIVGNRILGETLSFTQLLGAATVIVGCALVLGLVPLRRQGPAS